MVLSTLGKRARGPDTPDASPLKRPRRQTRAFVVINDENQDPEKASFEEALAADGKAAACSTPAKSTREQASPCKTSPTKRTASRVPLTPSTPRFRTQGTDAAAASPAASVQPVTPVTPRFRVMSAGRLSRRTTPQRSPRDRSAALGRGDAPMTPHTPSGCQTVYHRARQLFARSAGGAAATATGTETATTLVGREEERARLHTFLQGANGCLYVSGPPGTGKSAMVTDVVDETLRSDSNPARPLRKAYINCMSIRSSKDLYGTLLRLLTEDAGEETAMEVDVDVDEVDAVDALQALFLPKGKPSSKSSKAAAAKTPKTTYVVVLDEIDHILTLDLDSLYRVIEWSMLKATSQLLLVGIANALDLTDRFLPRLKSRNLQPELLPFLPYTAAQIKNIILTRLKSVVADDGGSSAPLPFFHPAAVELCARKVASQTGDLRKAFEILRRALDHVEAEVRDKFFREQDAARLADATTPTKATKKQPLGENTNLASSSPSTAATTPSRTTRTLSWAAWAAENLTAQTAPRVSIGHLNRVTAAAFGNGTQQRLRGLNLQQKAALCALVAFEKWSREAHAQQQQAQAAPDQAAFSCFSSFAAGGAKKATGTGAGAATPRVAKAAKTATAAPTVKKLFDTYRQLCKRDAVLHPLSSSEFREVVGSLETLSLVTAVDGRTGSFAVLQGAGRRAAADSSAGAAAGAAAGDARRVASCVGEKELQQALEGAGADILQSLLSGEALD